MIDFLCSLNESSTYSTNVLLKKPLIATAESFIHIAKSSCAENNFCSDICDPLISGLMNVVQSQPKQLDKTSKELGQEIDSALKVSGM